MWGERENTACVRMRYGEGWVMEAAPVLGSAGDLHARKALARRNETGKRREKAEARGMQC